MEKMKDIKCRLIEAVQAQVADIKHVNAKELGEVIDCIKDLEESLYYASIIQAMEKTEEEEEKRSYNNINYYMDNPVKMYGGRRMYNDRPWYEPSSGDRQYYVPYMEYAPYMMRDKDWREAHMYSEGSKPMDRSSMSRRMYMENKKNKVKDTESMQDLEHYIKDLGDDLTDMIQNSTPEEKQVLSTKLQQLASKVNMK